MIKPYIDLYTRLFLIIAGLIITLNHLFLFDFPRNHILVQIVLVLIIFSTSYNLVNRDFYLPFLGHTVYPKVADSISGDLISVQLENLPADTNVVYWASEEGESPFENPIKAYGNYKNSGFGKSDKDGKITIKILKPAPYKIPKKFTKPMVIEPHVHYRYEYKDYPGMFSRILTKKINN